MNNPYKILFKFASRSREVKFFKGLDNILTNIHDKENFIILCSLDLDDTTMYNQQTIQKLKQYLSDYPNNIKIMFGSSKNKIDAINRDVNEIKDVFDFDILVNFSDDMEFTKEGFDTIIRSKFSTFYPDTDGNIYFNDGFTKDKISTMSIIGRKWYDKYNYIYHPSYKSLWCDNEYTIIAKKDNKLAYFDEQLFIHKHPANMGGFIDEQLKHTESFSQEDYDNFLTRQKNEFQ